MDVTFTVPSNIVKKSIDAYVKENLYDAYSKATLKAARVPAKKTLVAQLIDDPKFMKALTREFNDFFTYWCQEELEDHLEGLHMPVDLILTCEKVQEREGEEFWAAQQKEVSPQTRLAILALERDGYTVTKPG